MTWSLSQDDDGLDGLGSSPEAAGPVSAAVLRNLPGRSVVVDPVSQIPEAPQPAPSVPRRTAEATLVLRNRQLDRLRAEVRSRQIAFRRRRVGALVVWGFAGGAAVFLGALLAKNWSDDEVEMGSVPVAAALPAALVAAPQPVEGAARVSAVSPSVESAASTTSAPMVARSLSASGEDSTRDNKATRVAPTSSRVSKTAPTQKGAKTTAHALSLDELPTE